MHGGDIYRNKVHTDYSVNVNPLGIPEQVRDAMVGAVDLAQNYPDANCEELREKLAQRFGLRRENVVCGNGASELILAICRWKRPKKALLLAPGFSGYTRALRALDCRITNYYLRKKEEFLLTAERTVDICDLLRKGGYGLFFLTNPANPTGSLTDREFVRLLAQACKDAGTVMVVDECFMELTQEPKKNSMIDELCLYDNVLVLRAFTKSFAMPGIRLGYLLCGNGRDAEKIMLQLPEWNVSLPAQAAGSVALEQEEYLTASREFIKAQREYLEDGLNKLGARVFHSDANFILFQWKDEKLYEKLLCQGILIRDCSDFEGLGKGYFRIAVKNRLENEWLLKAIKALYE